jgi:hypothetical protein
MYYFGELSEVRHVLEIKIEGVVGKVDLHPWMSADVHNRDPLIFWT